MRGILSVAVGLQLFCFCIPSLALIKGIETSDKRFVSVVAIPDCSAIVIHPQLIVSAAHCLEATTQPFNMDVGFKTRGTTQRLQVNRVVMNPQYNPKYVNSDLDLIILQNPIQDTDVLSGISPIGIPQPTQTFTAVGFGDTSRPEHGAMYSEINNEKRYLNFNFVNIASDVLIITAERPRTGACHGDSGGGVFQFDSNGKQTLVGVMSAITDYCGKTGSYLDTVILNSHLDWIRQVTGFNL